MIKTLGITLGAILGVTYGIPAFAQANCLPTERVPEVLKEFKEWNVFVGLSPDGTLIRVYLNEETGTFTIFILPSPELSCPVAAGHAGQLLDKPEEVPEGELN